MSREVSETAGILGESPYNVKNFATVVANVQHAMGNELQSSMELFLQSGSHPTQSAGRTIETDMHLPVNHGRVGVRAGIAD
jgi:hypothetical protein